MRLQISEINNFRDALIARGLAQVLEAEGFTVALEETSSPGFPPSPAAPSAAAGVAPAPVAALSPVAEKNKPGRKPNASKPEAKREVPAPETLRSPSDDAPRVTIRSRIKAILAGGQKTPREIAAILNGQGVGTDAQLVGQHLYLMTRDKVAVKNEDAGTWSLA